MRRIVLLLLAGCSQVVGIDDWPAPVPVADGASSSAGGDTSTSTTAAQGGAGGTSTVSSSTSSSSVGDAGVGGSCEPTTTCALEDVMCGLLDDGCGQVDCGPYDDWSMCNYPGNLTCTCSASYPFAVECPSATDSNTEAPTDLTCVPNPNPGTAHAAWCCTATLP